MLIIFWQIVSWNLISNVFSHQKIDSTLAFLSPFFCGIFIFGLLIFQWKKFTLGLFHLISMWINWSNKSLFISVFSYIKHLNFGSKTVILGPSFLNFSYLHFLIVHYGSTYKILFTRSKILIYSCIYHSEIIIPNQEKWRR